MYHNELVYRNKDLGGFENQSEAVNQLQL